MVRPIYGSLGVKRLRTVACDTQYTNGDEISVSTTWEAIYHIQWWHRYVEYVQYSATCVYLLLCEDPFFSLDYREQLVNNTTALV